MEEDRRRRTKLPGSYLHTPADHESFHSEKLLRYSRLQYALEMTHCAVIRFLCVFGVFQTGLTALVQTQQTVMAAVGQEARFSCQLMQTKDVLEVTWLKILPEEEENIAFYHKYYGERVNPDFRNKVEFIDARLQSCSIVIRKVTEQDEGCYQCLFNTYPEGVFTATTCLQLYAFDDESGSNNSQSRLWYVVLSVAVVCAAAAALIILLQLKKQNSLSHINMREMI